MSERLAPPAELCGATVSQSRPPFEATCDQPYGHQTAHVAFENAHNRHPTVWHTQPALTVGYAYRIPAASRRLPDTTLLNVGFFRFHAPAPLLSVNRAFRQHGARTGSQLAPWRDLARVATRHARNLHILPRPLPHTTVHVALPHSRPAHADPHNYTGTVVKALVDGLVAGGCWPDDTARWVAVADPTLHAGEPWVTLTLLTPSLPQKGGATNELGEARR